MLSKCMLGKERRGSVKSSLKMERGRPALEVFSSLFHHQGFTNENNVVYICLYCSNYPPDESKWILVLCSRKKLCT